MIQFFLSLLILLNVVACAAEPEVKSTLSPKEAAIFYSHVADRVRREFVEPVTDDKLLEGALNGMLMSLDPHSGYLDPKKYDLMKKQAQGRYGGLGMEITMEEGAVKVISPIDDSPAQKAGVRAGDLIVAIDKTPVMGMSAIESSERLRGGQGTPVVITIRRDKEGVFDLKIVREVIVTKPIKWRIEKDTVGYLRITAFSQETARDLHKAIAEIQQKVGDKLLGFVVDVRNNPGGLLESAVAVCESFLDKGEIVSVKGRNVQKAMSFQAHGEDLTMGKPLVVLINGGSASASEIVAAALQDNKRAVVVGTKSFGKGSVQSVVPTTNGGAIKLTTAYYYTPSGKTIQKKGVTPDVVVEQRVDLKTLKEDARFRESSLVKALGGDEATDPAVEKKVQASGSSLAKDQADYQLDQAIGVLNVMKLYETRNPGQYLNERRAAK